MIWRFGKNNLHYIYQANYHDIVDRIMGGNFVTHLWRRKCLTIYLLCSNLNYSFFKSVLFSFKIGGCWVLIKILINCHLTRICNYCLFVMFTSIYSNSLWYMTLWCLQKIVYRVIQIKVYDRVCTFNQLINWFFFCYILSLYTDNSFLANMFIK